MPECNGKLPGLSPKVSVFLIQKLAEDVDKRALVEWDESENVDDGRPDYSERKFCNFETSWMADCPSKLLEVCKTKDEIERMQFWELFSENEFEEGNWDMD